MAIIAFSIENYISNALSISGMLYIDDDVMTVAVNVAENRNENHHPKSIQ